MDITQSAGLRAAAARASLAKHCPGTRALALDDAEGMFCANCKTA